MQSTETNTATSESTDETDTKVSRQNWPPTVAGLRGNTVLHILLLIPFPVSRTGILTHHKRYKPATREQRFCLHYCTWQLHCDYAALLTYPAYLRQLHYVGFLRRSDEIWQIAEKRQKCVHWRWLAAHRTQRGCLCCMWREFYKISPPTIVFKWIKILT